jgi:hypothetical protein
VRQVIEFVNRLRWGTLAERRERGLVRVHDLLAASGFEGRYWIILGLLLGCMRDGGPIAWDRDADFGFMEEDEARFLSALERLRANGFQPRRLQVNNDGRTTKWALKFQGVKYEFFRFERSGSKLRWYVHRREPPTELVNEVPAHGFETFKLFGRDWLIPDNADDILGRIYGNWRKPDPQYAYWRDCRATIDSYPWTGERRRYQPSSRA